MVLLVMFAPGATRGVVSGPLCPVVSSSICSSFVYICCKLVVQSIVQVVQDSCN